MKSKLFAFLVAVPALLCGCSSDDDNSTSDDNGVKMPSTGELALTAQEQEMAVASNEFAFRLTKEAARCTNGNSFVVSPLSVACLLGMINDGARGTTQEEIMQVLGFGHTGAEAVNDYFSKMMQQVLAIDPHVRINASNALFGNSALNVRFASNFVNDMSCYYGATAESLDFTDIDKTLATINGWASNQTEGMIPNILMPDEHSPGMLCYLLDAIFFKAEWSSRFDKSMTVNCKFTLADGNQQSLPMMHKTDTIPYIANNEVKAVSLPYGNGDYNMAVLLPQMGTKNVEGLVNWLTAEHWRQTMRHMSQSAVQIRFPRFTTATDVNMTPVLQSMGMTTAFTAKADFSGMLESGSPFIGMMKQKAKIEVSEEGTQAAAVTITGMATASLDEKSDVKQFIADKPFVYIIYEKSTGVIFFTGVFTGKE